MYIHRLINTAFLGVASSIKRGYYPTAPVSMFIKRQIRILATFLKVRIRRHPQRGCDEMIAETRRYVGRRRGVVMHRLASRELCTRGRGGGEGGTVDALAGGVARISAARD
jgi:hypothetical protein